MGAMLKTESLIYLVSALKNNTIRFAIIILVHMTVFVNGILFLVFQFLLLLSLEIVTGPSR